jgi:hypothetical protein
MNSLISYLSDLIMEVSAVNNLYYLQEKKGRKERQSDRDSERNLEKSKEEEGKWLFDR